MRLKDHAPANSLTNLLKDATNTTSLAKFMQYCWDRVMKHKCKMCSDSTVAARKMLRPVLVMYINRDVA